MATPYMPNLAQTSTTQGTNAAIDAGFQSYVQQLGTQFPSVTNTAQAEATLTAEIVRIRLRIQSLYQTDWTAVQGQYQSIMQEICMIQQQLHEISGLLRASEQFVQSGQVEGFAQTHLHQFRQQIDTLWTQLNQFCSFFSLQWQGSQWGVGQTFGMPANAQLGLTTTGQLVSAQQKAVWLEQTYSIMETETHVIVNIDMPGVDVEKLDIQIYQGLLTIRGERLQQQCDSVVCCRHNNVLTGLIDVSIPLARSSEAFDLSQTQAKMRLGVLHVEVAKATQQTPNFTRIRGVSEAE